MGLSYLFRGITAVLCCCTVVFAQEIHVTRITLSELLPLPTATRVVARLVPTIAARINDITINLNTSTSVEKILAPAAAVTVKNTKNTVLILVRDTESAYSAYSGLNGYGIPYQVLNVPAGGTKLPVLNSTADSGNFGAIVVLSEVSYENSRTGSFDSALTASQWQSLYQYQVSFGVRMVRLDALPGTEFGTSALGACCDDGVEQLISITDSSAFPTAGLNT